MVQSASQRPELWVGEGPVKERVLPRCTVLHAPYRPSPLALSPHAQNILGYLRGSAISNSNNNGGSLYARQLVLAPDGGTLGLDWFCDCDDRGFGPPDLPVLLVLHGINGGSHEGYCKWVCHCATTRATRAQRWRAVVLNYRGCNGLPLTSPRGYAATHTHDVHVALASIRARFPDAPLLAVGYSLGGVLLTKFLGEAGAGLHPGAPRVAAAAVVSSPVCLTNSSAKLSQPWTPGFLYSVALGMKLRQFVAQHEDAIAAGTSQLDIGAALGRHSSGSSSATVQGAVWPWSSSTDAVSAAATAAPASSKWWTTMDRMEAAGIPATFGYRSRAEYYEAASSLPHIRTIATPTLFLLSRDDPFLGVLPDAECAANPMTLLAATARGGHVAFLQGWTPVSSPAYMDDAVLQFMSVVLMALNEDDKEDDERAAAAAAAAADAKSIARSVDPPLLEQEQAVEVEVDGSAAGSVLMPAVPSWLDVLPDGLVAFSIAPSALLHAPADGTDAGGADVQPARPSHPSSATLLQQSPAHLRARL